MDSQTVHDLAIVYAQSKMDEYELDNRDALINGNVAMSKEEIQYLESAYNFAIQHLSE